MTETEETYGILFESEELSPAQISAILSNITELIVTEVNQYCTNNEESFDVCCPSHGDR